MSAQHAAGGQSTTGCQISIYPLRQEALHFAIEDAVAATLKEGLSPRVGKLSTYFEGDEAAVFRALQKAFSAARQRGDAVMVATLSTSIPSDQRVEEVQRDAEAESA